MTKIKGAPHRYLVKLMRPVFQVTVVEVDAKTQDEAIGAAKAKAAFLDDECWEGEFDPNAYDYDVQVVIDKDDEQIDWDPDGESMDEVLGGYVQYALLSADTFSGEGSVPFQPWMGMENSLMMADLTGDWVAQLGTLNDSALDIWRKELGAIRPKEVAAADPDGSDDPDHQPAT